MNIKKKRNDIMVLIPARMNSSRLKNKNLKKINNKELIYYPINSAKNSKYVNKILVSTDSKKIAKIANKYGAETPFLRPKVLSTNQSPVIDTILYTLARLEKNYSYKPDYVIIIQPTSPLITSDLIDKAIKKAEQQKADSVVGLTPLDTTTHPFNIRKIDNKKIVRFWKDKEHYNYVNRSKPNFFQSGGIYLSTRKNLIKTKKIEGKKNYHIMMDKLSSFDIDTIEDFKIISKLMKK